MRLVINLDFILLVSPFRLIVRLRYSRLTIIMSLEYLTKALLSLIEKILVVNGLVLLYLNSNQDTPLSP